MEASLRLMALSLRWEAGLVHPVGREAGLVHPVGREACRYSTHTQGSMPVQYTHPGRHAGLYTSPERHAGLYTSPERHAGECHIPREACRRVSHTQGGMLVYTPPGYMLVYTTRVYMPPRTISREPGAPLRSVHTCLPSVYRHGWLTVLHF